jgi:hypothetical protein
MLPATRRSLDAEGTPTHDEAPGVNVVLERSARGSALVQAAWQP